MYYWHMDDERKKLKPTGTVQKIISGASAALNDWEEKWEAARQERIRMTQAGYYVVHLEESQVRVLQQLADVSASGDIEALASKLLGEAIDRLAAETEV